MAVTVYTAGPIGAAGTPSVAFSQYAGNTVQPSGPNQSEITLAAGALPMYVSPSGMQLNYTRLKQSTGIGNGNLVVDVVWPNGFNDPQSVYAVVYTVAGGVLT